MLNRAEDPSWQQTEYQRLMGEEAAIRQARAAAREAALARRCTCDRPSRLPVAKHQPHCPQWKREEGDA